ncbi:unnamed protein product [marine sediment metagenome]|uniref:Uncharacterized protein n=1 Tax=marine sediment metagenome TaxID=412755 RepID=X1CA11_9ZZZZ
MRLIGTLVLALFLLSLSNISLASEKKLSADDILDKVEDINETKSRIANITMILIDKNDKKKNRKVKIWTKEDDKRLIKFLFPADVAGVGFLVLDAGDQGKYEALDLVSN